MDDQELAVAVDKREEASLNIHMERLQVFSSAPPRKVTPP